MDLSGFFTTRETKTNFAHKAGKGKSFFSKTKRKELAILEDGSWDAFLNVIHPGCIFKRYTPCTKFKAMLKTADL